MSVGTVLPPLLSLPSLEDEDETVEAGSADVVTVLVGVGFGAGAGAGAGAVTVFTTSVTVCAGGVAATGVWVELVVALPHAARPRTTATPKPIGRNLLIGVSTFRVNVVCTAVPRGDWTAPPKSNRAQLGDPEGELPCPTS